MVTLLWIDEFFWLFIVKLASFFIGKKILSCHCGEFHEVVSRQCTFDGLDFANLVPDIASHGRELQCVNGSRPVDIRRGNVTQHNGLGVAAEGVLEQRGEHAFFVLDLPVVYAEGQVSDDVT